MVSVEELELIGALIGDGHIHKKPRRYYVGFTGSIKTDYPYFEKLVVLIEQVWGKKTRIVERSGGLRITFGSRRVVEKLTLDYGLPFNDKKCYIVSIPEFFAKNFNNAKHILRGLADTDGSVFVSDKPGSPNYPAIEITTVSKKLALQVREILLSAGFRVTNLHSNWSKLSTAETYKVCLYGKANLEKWIKEIGFSNPYKLNRAISAL